MNPSMIHGVIDNVNAYRYLDLSSIANTGISTFTFSVVSYKLSTHLMNHWHRISGWRQDQVRQVPSECVLTILSLFMVFKLLLQK